MTLHQLIETLSNLSGADSTALASSPSRDLPVLLDATEAARLLSLSRAKVGDMALRGEIACIRFGRLVRIPRDPLLAWIQKNTNAAQGPAVRLPEWAHVDRSGEL